MVPMITKNENGFGWGSLLLAVLFFIAGWTALRNPLGTLLTLGIVFGITAIVQGAFAVAHYFELRRSFVSNSWLLLLVGILDLLLGFYLVFNPEISITFLPMLFAFWFLFDSVMNIFIAFRLRKISRSWFWLRLILGALGVLVGLSLATNLLAALLSVTTLIALYFFTTAVIKLIDAFV